MKDKFYSHRRYDDVSAAGLIVPATIQVGFLIAKFTLRTQWSWIETLSPTIVCFLMAIIIFLISYFIQLIEDMLFEED